MTLAWSEKLAEALVQVLPVVSNKVGMVPDFLPESCIIPPNNIEALQQMLLSAISDPNDFVSLCEPAFQVAKKHLTIDAMTDRIEQVYQQYSRSPVIFGMS
ncbi:MAG: hypothetical protein MI976_13385 [Pseudomonadales bacterium]|nr:hypothetical protein [Pseudomonadales bacterium]